jgi:hypothetical protein
MLNVDIISMPDKWEYPWYAAWTAFHTLALSLVDFDFARPPFGCCGICIRIRTQIPL